MLHLAVVASLHVVLYIEFSSVYLSSKWIRSCKHMVFANKKYRKILSRKDVKDMKKMMKVGYKKSRLTQYF